MSRISKPNRACLFSFEEYLRKNSLTADIVVSIQKAIDICQRDENLEEKMNEFPAAHHPHLFKALEDGIELFYIAGWDDGILCTGIVLSHMKNYS